MARGNQSSRRGRIELEGSGKAVIHSGPSPSSPSSPSRPRAPDLQAQCGSVIFKYPDAGIVGPIDHSR